MEIEKPFKCIVCNSQFTNEDHLQVHKKRHEMSLNLSKSGSQQSQTALEGFVDETPTPTRFFRNCEEVGLFQDLQHVNPFDEQFSKAASATPSAGGEPFDFSLAMSSSSISISAASAVSASSSSSSNTNSGNNNSNKRRYSDQDTLNTPQVFGYVMNATNSTTTNTCSTTSILTPMPPSSSLTLDDKKPSDSKNADEKPFVEKSSNFKVIKSQFAKSASSPKNSTNTVISPSPAKSKTTLRLNLSPITPVLYQEQIHADSSNTKGKSTPEPEKKAEMLERNRAAASRSRQRRKQWVSSLESKCQTLESLLAQARAEIVKQQTENQILRNELSRHVSCDVSIRGDGIVVQPPQGQQIQILVRQKQPQPNILRQVSQPVVVTSAAFVIESNCEAASTTFNSSASPVVVPRMKAKRGRPRKGQERRIGLLGQLNVPFSTSTASILPEVPVKIQIIPITRSTSDGSA